MEGAGITIACAIIVVAVIRTLAYYLTRRPP